MLVEEGSEKGSDHREDRQVLLAHTAHGRQGFTHLRVLPRAFFT